MDRNKTSLLKVENLTKIFKIGGLVLGEKLTAVDNVSFQIESDKPVIFSVIGESGSGKTTLARLILKLIEPTNGKIFINGLDISRVKSKEDFLNFRRLVQPVFQDPYDSFNPMKKVDNYLLKTALKILKVSKRKAFSLVDDALKSVGLSFEKITGKFMNQFSGGELQRISIARALIPKPKLIVADEPVSMVDASIRMNIMNLFKELNINFGINFIYITHDLSTAYYLSDIMAIMYRGNIVEIGPSSLIFADPLHPYTELLLKSIPEVGKEWKEDIKLSGIETEEYGFEGCKFYNRCPYADEHCKKSRPILIDKGDGRKVACFKYDDNLSRALSKSLK
ncbi:MAG TPA: ABC transporter ATP-binding protein [Thermotogaceae bacterium]|nr:ABC transporter ATP-binding protein [Thermotogaceae bacterium]